MITSVRNCASAASSPLLHARSNCVTAFVDAIVLQDAAEIEHYEIGVYENLILWARAMHRHDVAELLQRNIESERMALGKIMALQAELAPVRGTGAI